MEIPRQATQSQGQSAQYFVPSPALPNQPTWGRAAQEGIARRYAPLLYKLARQLTGNDSDARDLVQDTLERSLRKLPVGLPPHKIQCWLQVTLRHRFVDLRRSLKHRARTTVKEGALFTLPAQDADEEPAWAQIDPEQLWLRVDHLNPLLRDVLLLRVRERRSHSDIAARLGIPVSTVGTRYFRALRHLRRMLGSATGRADRNREH